MASRHQKKNTRTRRRGNLHHGVRKKGLSNYSRTNPLKSKFRRATSEFCTILIFTITTVDHPGCSVRNLLTLGESLCAVTRMSNKWRTINSWVHKIRLHGRRGKETAESFSRQKLRQAPQKKGGEILCD